MKGASGAGYQSSWGMGNRTVEILEQAIITQGIELSP